MNRDNGYKLHPYTMQTKKGDLMPSIHTKQYQIMTDQQLVWDLLIQNYAPRMAQGIAAPFYEYALVSSWMDTRYLYRNRLWLDGDQAVGFVYYENPAHCIFFSLLPGYDFLAEEMIAWAEEGMPGSPKEKELIFFPGQQALMEAAGKRGYRLSWQEEDYLLDMESAVLDHPLPPGFHFVDAAQADPVKLARCAWKGFGHEDKGPFLHWDAPEQGDGWTPQRAYRGVHSCFMAPPPHATYARDVITADAHGEYACYAGMWWVPENQLAYMEPLCTIPEYRGMGLAKAALSEHYRRLKPRGAKYMTGGGDPFYQKIGYQEKIQWLHFRRKP